VHEKLGSDDDIVQDLIDDFDAVACDYCEDYKSEGLEKSSAVLLEFLAEKGLSGKTILELGCGPGGFTIECLKKGAARGVGMDLSPEMIKTANELASNLNFQDRAKFIVGNAATAEIPSSDIVVMDKMLCCFPDAKSILQNVILASGSGIGFVVPRDQGLFKVPLRIAVFFKDLYDKIRNQNLGWLYLHSLPEIDRILRNAGFTQRQRAVSGFWIVFLYSKDGF
jgi:SAM-dependent methyltransferase